MYRRISHLQGFSMRLMQVFSGLATALMLVADPALAAAGPSAATHQGTARVSQYRNLGHSHAADMMNADTWGVEQLRVHATSSGTLIRFSYRVVDVNKAKVLQAKKAEPHLIGLRTHAMLSVPTLENVGQLRQTEAIQNGKDYWVLFSNKGNLVKVGDRVDVVIGDFYVSGLTVE